jgi:nucleotide-binding universal stress UspA family protein
LATLKKVLVGTDLSESSLALLSYLPRLREAGLEHIVLMHMVHIVGVEGMVEVLIEQAEEDTHAQAERLREAGFSVDPVVKIGSSPSALAHTAEKRGVAAIVVGSHGRSKLSRVLLGSVAMSVLHHATVPVLIVRMDLCETNGTISCEAAQKPLSHLLFPTDFSEGSEAAFEWLVAFAAETGARVTLVHAQDTHSIGHDVDVESFNDADRKLLRQHAVVLRDAGVGDVETVVETGRPAEVINRVAAEDNASMIVMSTHGKGALEDLLLGSVALKVARTAPVPVMMVPAGAVKSQHRDP